MRRPIARSFAVLVVLLVPCEVAAQESSVAVDAQPAAAAGTAEAPATETPMTFEEALHGLYAPRAEDRRAAIRRLTELGDQAAVANLIEALRQDPDAEVRRYAVVALVNLRATSAMEALSGVAMHDPSAAVRTAAAQGITRLGGTPPNAPSVAPSPPAVPVPPPIPVPPPPVAAIDDGLRSTMLTFRSPGGAVRIERVRAHHRIWVGLTQGGPNSARGVSTEPVCTTPCTTSVPNGEHTFVAGDYEFDVRADGGSQTWEVEGTSEWGYWGGIILLCAGGALAVTGGMMLGVMGTESGFDTMNWVLLGSGLGTFAIGIPVLVLSLGSAERVQGAPLANRRLFATDAVRWSPGLMAARDVDGHSVWGLGLALSL